MSSAKARWHKHAHTVELWSVILFYFFNWIVCKRKADAEIHLLHCLTCFAAWGIVGLLISSIFKINLMHVDVFNVRKNTRANL